MSRFINIEDEGAFGVVGGVKAVAVCTFGVNLSWFREMSSEQDVGWSVLRIGVRIVVHVRVAEALA